MAIKTCDCHHEGQDKIHGKGKRVKNETKDQPIKHRCTVCTKED